jgi:hypothetical protein
VCVGVRGLCVLACECAYVLPTKLRTTVWLYHHTAHLVQVMFRNAAACFGAPGLYLDPKKEHPVLTVQEAGCARAKVCTLQ